MPLSFLGESIALIYLSGFGFSPERCDFLVRKTLDMGVGNFVTDIAFSPDGKLMAVCCGGIAHEDEAGGVRGYPVPRGEWVVRLTGHGGRVNRAAFTPDGSTLICVSEGPRCIAWEVQSWRQAAEFRGHSVRCAATWDSGRANPHGMAFAPDGRSVVIGYSDGNIACYDVATRKSMAKVYGHDGYVIGLGFHPSGKMFASGSAIEFDLLGRPLGKVRLWPIRVLGGSR